MGQTNSHLPQIFFIRLNQSKTFALRESLPDQEQIVSFPRILDTQELLGCPFNYLSGKTSPLRV
ncbi:MAG TPA: hypothetical protein VK469_11370, partial [Candidatus Kapabacteria bacterium]|nr:hypothetical protein [Candidatus Kapabacteria bacterium]